MTSKEKAQSLYNDLAYNVLPDCVEVHHDLIKKAAVFVVDEILKVSDDVYFDEGKIRYWKEVKKEINLL